jgi:hypothetical protein
MGAAYNFAFVAGRVQAPFFMWAAADDKWHPMWIETLLPIAQQFDCLAFGAIQQIDCNNKYVQHVANFQAYDFLGHQFLRRIRYIINDPKNGKANPIYGIIPSRFLDEKNLQPLSLPFDNSDNLFLYNLLEQTQIRCDSSVWLYKRTASGACLNTESLDHKTSLSLIRSGKSLPKLRVVSAIADLKNDAFCRFLVFNTLNRQVHEILLCHLFAYAYVLRRISGSVLRLLLSCCR